MYLIPSLKITKLIVIRINRETKNERTFYFYFSCCNKKVNFRIDSNIRTEIYRAVEIQCIR